MPPRRLILNVVRASDGRDRNVFYTLNNPLLDEAGMLLHDGSNRVIAGVKWHVWQYEIGETGTPHIQGALVFKDRVSFDVARRRLPGCHIEWMTRAPAEARRYCMLPEGAPPDGKAGGRPTPAAHMPQDMYGPWEFGTPPSGQGARTDITDVMQMVDNNEGMLEIAQAYPNAFMKYHKGIEKYMLLTCVPRDFVTRCYVYWGPSGSGKSRMARNFGRSLAGEVPKQFWLPQPRTRATGAWFSGYTGQSVVVIDEFYGWLSRSFCCTMCDRNPLLVEPKGGTFNFVSEYVVFTSNKAIEDWWPVVGVGPMRRRTQGELGKIVYVGNAQYPTAESYKGSMDYGNPDYEEEVEPRGEPNDWAHDRALDGVGVGALVAMRGFMNQ